MFLKLFPLLFCLLGLNAQAAVWTDVNQWSPAYEDRFAEWVRSEWRTDFFSRKSLPNGQSNPYYGMRVDCADTVYSMRIIFAYENRLPFVIQDPTASGKTLSNKMSRWDSQNEIQRLRNFLWYMYGIVSTRSVPNDTYPISIRRETVRSGALILTTKKNHHSWTVKEILPIGVPHLVYNSVVGANSGFGLQERQSWPNPAWVFEENFSAAGHGGFRDWRPIAFINKPVWSVPGYSEEQYKIPLNKWVRQVQGVLALRQETDVQMINRLVKNVCAGLVDRVTAVNDGVNYLKTNPRCMDYATYDTYSTPNRDRRIFDDFLSLRQAYRDILRANGGNNLDGQTIQQLNHIFPAITQSVAYETSIMSKTGTSSHSLCVTTYLPGKSMDLAEFKRRIFTGLISNNPHDPGAYRWGDLRGPSQHARTCQSWDPWSPDLNQN